MPFFVFSPAGADEVAARDALGGGHLELLDDHRAAVEVRAVPAEDFGVLRHVGGDEVVGDVFEEVEPEEAELGEHAALVGDAVGHDAVEGADAVGGDEEEGVAEVVDVADLAADGRLEFGDGALEQGVVLVVFHGVS